MATAVFFHAHPDDEAIATGGTMAAMADAGHRVVLVVATRGELGEIAPGVMEEGEALGERRTLETMKAAEVLGVGRVVFLDYHDSGMMGEPTNDDPSCFWQAEVEGAAERLGAVLREERADVLTVYDDHGSYGHPDHIQVHRVGRRAAELAGVDRVFESTMNRDALRRMIAEMPQLEEAFDEEERRETAVGDDFGTPEELITHALDVGAVIERKRAAMVAHASQIPPDSFFLRLPPPRFAAAFGTEWYIAPGRPRPEGTPFATDLLA